MTYGGMEVQLHAFSTSALDEGEWSTSCPDRPRERGLDTHGIGGWMSPKAGLDAVATRRKKISTLPASVNPAYTDWATSDQRMRTKLILVRCRSIKPPQKQKRISIWHKMLSKRPEREADHSPPSSAEVKKARSQTSTPRIRLYGVVLTQAQR
jgi:hypothetical protein